MGKLRGIQVSVIGAARSGLDAARVLTRLGAEALLSDSQPAAKLGAARMAEIEATGARWTVGATVATALPPETELVVTSPGVPKSAAVLKAAVDRKIPIWSEIELAYRLARIPIAAVTGTNGKTTTTLLLAAILHEAGIAGHIAGNVSADEIKRTLVDAADAEDSGVLVAEISSFQLEWVEQFAPKVAILTNITPDHLNRHQSFEEYAATKARLFAAQTDVDWAILNYDNPTARTIGASALPGRRIWFTRQDAPPDDTPAVWLSEGAAILRMSHEGRPVRLFHTDDLPPSLPGGHNIENAMAAATAVYVLGASPDAIVCGLRAFRGVPHRLEWITDIDGVRYINNSMCTNIAAGISSIEALDRPILLIAGGADKELDFAPLTPTLRAKVRRTILIGAATEKMEATFRAGGYETIERATTLEEAVARARSIATPGDVVLLSPTCASFDMFADFEARGKAFRRAVSELKENQKETAR